TAPGLAARLADGLLAAASASAEAGDEDAALGYCEQVRELGGAPDGALAAAQAMILRYRAQREGEAALAEAAARIDAAGRSHPPSAEAYSQAIAVLKKAAAAAEEAKELAPRFDALHEQAEDGRKRALAAQPLLAESEALAAAGDWAGSAAALAAAQTALGPLAGSEMIKRLAQLQDRAETVASALAPAAAAVGRAEALYGLASDGDVSAVDWDALEQALSEARKTLRRQAGLPTPLPPAWEETRARAEALALRSKVLRGVSDKLAAGRGADAIPALQAEAGSGQDSVILAVLSRLLDETAGDAMVLARGWVTEAVAALGRGELATAGAYLELAQSYAPAAPQVVPEIRRIERQMAALAQVRRATAEAREHAANSETEAAFACFRRALELAADGEAGLPAAAKRKLHLLLDMEEDVASHPLPRRERDERQASNANRGEGLVQELLDWNASEPLVSEFVAPALARWWKLASRMARLAFVEAEMTLGRDDPARCAVAVEAAAGLVESYPSDRAALALYANVASRAGERLLARGKRRLERGQRLAARGAYAEALAEIAPDVMLPAHGGAAPAGIARSEEVEALADEAADLRAELQASWALSEQLDPLLQRMRDAALAGKVDEARAARRQAELVDPRRRVATVWEEFDAIGGIIAGRENSGTRLMVAPLQGRTEMPEERSPRQISGQPSEQRPAAEPMLREVPIETPETRKLDLLPVTSPTNAGLDRDVAPELAPSRRPVDGPAVPAPERAEPQEPPPLAEPVEPPAPFDLDDWLSNVTELSPEDGEPADES
ncbi:MAG: hypothetical protein ACM30E_03920, partial [Nitrososphaerales archaeon]